MMFGAGKKLETRLDSLDAKLDGLESLREEVHQLARHVDEFRLDYQGLYEKVRVQLAKLRNRSVSEKDNGPPPDPLVEARKALIRQKLGG